MKFPYLAVLIFISNTAFGACEDIILASKISNYSYYSRAELEATANSFCREYSSANSQNRNANFGLTYDRLSGFFNNSKVSANQVASRFCSSRNTGYASDDAYQDYVETISPRAYSAFETCEQLNSARGVVINPDPNAITPTTMSIAVNYIPAGNGSVTLAFSALSNLVTCNWNGTDLPQLALSRTGNAVLECTRDSSAEMTPISVFATDYREASVTIPWGRYNEEGVRLDNLQEMNRQLEELQAEVTELNNRCWQSNWNSIELGETYANLQHQLGSIPSQASIWLSPFQNGSQKMLIDSIFNGGGYGVWLFDVTESRYQLTVGPSALYSMYGETEAITHYGIQDGTRGFAQVVLCK